MSFAVRHLVLPALTLVVLACERDPGCLDNCAAVSPPPPERGAVTITVDPSRRLGAVVTGGGTNFTGFANYVDAAHARVDALAKLPYRLNRVHFSGEVPDLATFRTEDRLDAQYPQPLAPPASWNFKWLDGPVAVARQIRDASGTDFILTIHNAPQWMTTSDKVVGHAPRNADDYALYCARLVSYYNRGSFVDDAGRTVTNAAGAVGVKYWEIWNEPDIDDVGGTPDAVLSAKEYAQLFVKVTAAMRAIDPTIQIGGPNTIADYEDTLGYVHELLATGAKVDFIAVHQYQAASSMADRDAFRAASTIVNRPATTLPIIISESNSDAEDNQTRTGSPFEWAVMPLIYRAHVVAGTWRVLRWETYEKSYNLVDAPTGRLTATYWAESTFWRAVPEGSTRVECASSSEDIVCLAVLTPGGKLDVVAINVGVAGATDNNGVGVKHEVTVTTSAPRGPFAIRVVDRDMSASDGPRAAMGASFTMNGYGVAALEEP